MATWRRSKTSDEEAAEAVRASAWPLRGESSDYAPLLEAIGERKVVLLGAASEGAHEFNRERLALTQRLIVQKGFRVVAVEAAWPDAYRVNRYIHRLGFDESAEDALCDFNRFPSWRWRNCDALDLVSWLRQYNDEALRPERRVSFLGLDLYDLRASMDLAGRWLASRDRSAALAACRHFRRFDQFDQARRAFVRSDWALSRGLEREAACELLNLHRRALVRHAILNNDDGFLIEQSGRLLERAEDYYRCLLRGGLDAWNSYERHLAETVEALSERLERSGSGTKMAVWALNSHLGDASALAGRWRVSLGGLLRRRLGDDAFCVGLTTHEGTVIAAADWDGAPQCLRLRPAPESSVERLLHRSSAGDFLLMLGAGDRVSRALRGRRLERVVGAVYQPEEELTAHCFAVELPRQFDAVLHLDRTRGVELLAAPSRVRIS